MMLDDGRAATPVEAVAKPAWPAWRDAQPELAQAWLQAAGFAAEANDFAYLPDANGRPGRVVAGIGERASIESLGNLPNTLPPGDYRLAHVAAANSSDAYSSDAYRLALGWALGAYRFTAYKAPKRAPARLLVDDSAVLEELAAVALCRDLVNTPASDMLPDHLEAAARRLAQEHDACFEATTGDALLQRGLNTIHTVGRASASAPRLLELRWGKRECAKVVLVGKGVCFDSGGLDLKPASNMRLMKKDMGGAAHVLGLAKLVMSRRLPINLRVLIPAVENAVSANAYRPGDVIRTYQGSTVEVDNTDAEGRLVLADALALAAEEEPALVVDFATLTGAARTALGTELPAMFANRDAVANGIAAAADGGEDPVWRLPLFAPYRRLLESSIADVVNAPSAPYAGAIAAALFLQRFVGDVPWVHFDIMAWNLAARPAHPQGGEAMGLRAVYGYLAQRFGV